MTYDPGTGSRDLAEEKRLRQQAIDDPGPSWREWLYGSALKMWLGIGLLVVNSWIAAFWVELANWYALAVSLAIAVYFEYLLYQYLWHPYHPELRGKFRPTFGHPFEVGRWEPDREEALSPSAAAQLPPEGPDPRQFL